MTTLLYRRSPRSPIRNMPDPVAVNSMFSRIARRYDIANRLLSGGIDIWWRKRLVAAVRNSGATNILDLATGSGDVAFALSRGLPGKVAIEGRDFCVPMLEEAEKKKAAAGADAFRNVSFAQADALALPLPDARFDAVTISFGLRNLSDRARGLREMHRVLQPGGTLFVLEFSQPYRWFRPLYYFYLSKILPRLAGFVTGDRGAYDYLNNTIGTFPDRSALAGEIRAAGFATVRATPMTFGIVALHAAKKE